MQWNYHQQIYYDAHRHHHHHRRVQNILEIELLQAINPVIVQYPVPVGTIITNEKTPLTVEPRYVPIASNTDGLNVD